MVKHGVELDPSLEETGGTILSSSAGERVGRANAAYVEGVVRPLEEEVARLRRERDRYRSALEGVSTALHNAQREASHGPTASAAFIDQCVSAALNGAESALTTPLRDDSVASETGS